MPNFNKRTKSRIFSILIFLSFAFMLPNVIKNPNNQFPQKFESGIELKTSSNSLPLDLELNTTWGTAENDEFHSMTLDSEENVYLVGMAGWDLLTVKYNSSFDLEWNRIYPNSAGKDIAYDVALDSYGNVYVVGKYSPNGVSHSYLILLTYNNSGDFEWMKNWGGEGNFLSSGTALVIDSTDNIYVAGKTDSMGAGENDICLIKYNSTGDVQWYRLWGGPNDDVCNDITLDDQGNLYVAGYTKSYGLGKKDSVLIKFNSSGDEQWYETWGGENDDSVVSIALDSSDNIYISGTTQESGGDWHSIFLKYNSSGDFIWLRTWDAANTADGFTGLTIDDYNQSYLISIKNQPYTGFDLVILSYSSTGEKYWEYTWGTDEFDAGLHISFINPGSLYVAGITTGLGSVGEDGVLLKFSTNPLINIHSPNQNEFFSTTAPTYDLTVVSHTLDSIWYSFNDGLTNYSCSSTNGNINTAVWNSLSDGEYNLYFYANDSSGEICSSNVTIHKDTTSPTSTLHFYPYTGVNKVNISSIFTIYSSDGTGSGIARIFYRINGSSWYTEMNSNQYIFQLNPFSEPGFYLIEYYARDELGHNERIQSMIAEFVEITSQNPTTIPGYHLLIILSTMSLMIIFVIRKKTH